MISTEVAINRYSGNDATTQFVYAFKIDKASDLAVIVADADDNATTLTITTYYTVSDVGESEGYIDTVDLTAICGQATLPTGWSITLVRAVELLQKTDFINQGAFNADTHEAAFDFAMMVAQQQQEQLDRCVKVSQTSGDSGDDFLTTVIGYKTAAEVAKTAAEAAQADAETAQTAAEAAQADAETAQTGAEAAQTAAEAAATSVNLPSITGGALQYLRVKSDETGYEFQTLAELLNINGATDKVTPVAADEILIADSADSNALKKTDIGSLASALDINGATDKATPVAADEVLIADSADSNAIKKTDIAALVAAVASAPAVVQVTSAQTGAVATGTTVMPFDDSIPQISEGDLYLTGAITPTDSANTIQVDVVFYASVDPGGDICMAVYRDSTANAIAAGVGRPVDTTDPMPPLVIRHTITSIGTTSEITFTVRAGRSGSGTVTMNGQGSNRRFGGVMASSITLTEIAV